MESLFSSTFLPLRVPSLQQVYSFPFPTVVRLKPIKLSSSMRSAAARKEVVSLDQGKSKQVTVVGMLSVSLRSMSNWWYPLFKLRSDPGKGLLSAAESPIVDYCMLPSDLQDSSRLISTTSDANPTDSSKEQNVKRETACLPSGSSNVEPTDNTKHHCSSPNERKPRRMVKFTAEKAKMLRKQMRASETWHDVMYHSAIASRLAIPDN